MKMPTWGFALAASLASSCAGELSTDELLAGLVKQGVRVEPVKQKDAMQAAYDELGDAMASGVPAPRLKRSVFLEGVRGDIYWCPGKAEQAELVTAMLLRGPRPDDPPYLAQVSSHINGWLNLPFEDHIVSLSPHMPMAEMDWGGERIVVGGGERAPAAQDQEVLKIALALARLEDR